MNRSRIIRSIITIIFLICAISMLFVCVKNSLEIKSTFSLLYKFIYIAMIFVSILFYVVLKKKLNSMNCKKSIEYSYRYIYIVMLVLITRFIAVLLYKGGNIDSLVPSIENGVGSYVVYLLGKVTLHPFYAIIIINTLLTFGSAIIIKRLVFNITTNEILSAIATIGYIFIPQAIISTTSYSKYIFNTLFILMGIYILLMIIDEVKQHKLKNKKYLKLTCLMGVCIFLDILFGGRFEFWLIVLLSTLFISNNVGYVRVNNKREFVEKFSSVSARKLMYKMEAIAINKLIIVFFVLIGFILFAMAWAYILDLEMFNIYKEINISNAYNNLLTNISTTKNYYITILSIIILLDILGWVLKRKKDTKTTLIKLCTTLILLILLILNGNYVISTLDVFLVLTLILNVGNIYYNRDEKIKLLKAEN